MNRLYLIILLSLLFSSCANDRNAQIGKMNLDELFNYFLNTQDSLEEERLVGLLNDSIVKYPEGVFWPSEEIDSVKKELKFNLNFDTEPLWNDVKIKERNVFSLFIDRKNNQYIRWDKINALRFHREYMILFLTNPNNVDSLPEKRIKLVDLIGKVEVSKGAFVIKSQLIPDSTNHRTDWRLIKSNIIFIKNIILELRNLASIKYWNLDYNKLELDRKYILSNLHPMGIWFEPNRPFRPKPPPPPPPYRIKRVPIVSKEILDIINDEDDLVEELLK
jgi:hypothetical protein